MEWILSVRQFLNNNFTCYRCEFERSANLKSHWTYLVAYRTLQRKSNSIHLDAKQEKYDRWIPFSWHQTSINLHKHLNICIVRCMKGIRREKKSVKSSKTPMSNIRYLFFIKSIRNWLKNRCFLLFVIIIELMLFILFRIRM